MSNNIGARALVAILLLVATAFCGGVSAADVPGLLNYQGRITVSGANFNGTGRFKFALVTSAGVNLWSNDGSGVGSTVEPTASVNLTVTRGLYSSELGAAINPIPAAAFAGNADVRLRVWFSDQASGSLTQLSPDVRIVPSAYAFSAQSSNTVGNLAGNSVVAALNDPATTTSVSGAKLADGSVTNAKINDVAASKISGALSATQIANNSIDDTKIDPSKVATKASVDAEAATRAAADAALQASINTKADKPGASTAGNVASLTATGNLSDSGVASANIATKNANNNFTTTQTVNSGGSTNVAVIVRGTPTQTGDLARFGVDDGGGTGGTTPLSAIKADGSFAGNATGLTGTTASGNSAISAINQGTDGALNGAKLQNATVLPAKVQSSLVVDDGKVLVATGGTAQWQTVNAVVGGNVAVKNADNNFTFAQTLPSTGSEGITQGNNLIGPINQASTQINGSKILPNFGAQTINGGNIIATGTVTAVTFVGALNGNATSATTAATANSVADSGTSGNSIVTAINNSGTTNNTLDGDVLKDASITPAKLTANTISISTAPNSGLNGGGAATLGGAGVTLTNTDKGSDQFIFKNIANSAGATQFSAAANSDTLKVSGSGSTSVTFNSGTKEIVINSVDTNSGGTVTNVTGSAPIQITNNTTTPNITIADATTGVKGVVQVGSGLSVASGTVSVDTASIATVSSLTSGLNAKVSKTGDLMSGTLTVNADGAKIVSQATAGEAATSVKLAVNNNSTDTFKVTKAGDVTANTVGAASFAGNGSGLTNVDAATVNGATAASLRDRTTHSGQQPASSISDFNSAVQLNSVSTLAPAVGDLNLSTNKIVNVGGPAAPLDAANKQYVDSANAGQNTTIGTKADKVSGGGTAGKVSGLDASGNLTNTGLDANQVPQKNAANTFTAPGQVIAPTTSATGLAVQRGTSGQTQSIVEFRAENGTTVLSAIDAGGAFTGNAATSTTANSVNALSGNSLVTAIDNAATTNTIDGAKLTDKSISNAKISSAAADTGKALFANATGGADWLPALGAGALAGGDLTGTYPNPQIANGAVSNLKILPNTITTDRISGLGVTSQTGGVLFTNGSNQIVQNTNFTWDNINSLLSLGPVLAPNARLAVRPGTDLISGIVVRPNSATQQANLQEWQDSSASPVTLASVSPAGDIATKGKLTVEGASKLGNGDPTDILTINTGANPIVISNGGLVRSNASANTAFAFSNGTSGNKLDLSTDGAFSAGTTVVAGTGITATTGNIVASTGDINATAGNLNIAGTSTLTGNVGVGTAPTTDKLRVSGSTNLTGTLTQGGGAVALNGAVSTNSGLTVKGADLLVTNNTNATVFSVAQSSGNTQINGTLNVNDTSTLTGRVGVGGAPDALEALKVTGNAIVTGAVTVNGINNSGNLGVHGNLTVDGNSTLGSHTGQVVTIQTGAGASSLLTEDGIDRKAAIDTSFAFSNTGGGLLNLIASGSITAGAGVTATTGDIKALAGKVTASTSVVAPLVTSPGALTVEAVDSTPASDDLVLKTGGANRVTIAENGDVAQTGGSVTLAGALAANNGATVKGADLLVASNTATVFSVGQATGNTEAAGTLTSRGDLKVGAGAGTFNVTAASGDTAIGGNSTISGTTQISGNTAIGTALGAEALKVNQTLTAGGNSVLIQASNTDTGATPAHAVRTEIQGAGKRTVGVYALATGGGTALDLGNNEPGDITHGLLGEGKTTGDGLAVGVQGQAVEANGSGFNTGVLGIARNTTGNAILSGVSGVAGADDIQILTQAEALRSGSVQSAAITAFNPTISGKNYAILATGNSKLDGTLEVTGSVTSKNFSATASTGQVGLSVQGNGTENIASFKDGTGTEVATITNSGEFTGGISTTSNLSAATVTATTTTDGLKIGTGNNQTSLSSTATLTAKSISFPDASGTVALTNTTLAPGEISGSIGSGLAINTDAVTTVKIVDGAITTAKLADAAVSTVKIADNAVVTSKILNANVTTAKIADDAVVTSKILDANVTTAKIADDAVTTVKIVNDAVVTSKILDSNVTTAKIAADAVVTSKILNANVTTTKIADDAVITSKILDANVTTEKIADSAITTGKINDTAVTTEKIADANVTTVKIEDGAVTTAKIGVDAVTTSKILDANVTAGKIADDAVITSKILNLNVTSAKIADGAVVTSKILDANVTTGKIADTAITTGKINDAAVITAKIADANVTTEKIADGAVTTVKIVDSAVTSAKIADGTIVDADVSGTAAIAGTKVSPDFGSQNISTTGGLSAATLSGTLNVSNLAGTLGVANGGTGLNAIAVDNILYSSGANTLAPTSITAFGRSLIADADAAAGRASFGLGTIATQNANNVSISGGAINGTTIGSGAASTGAFTTLSSNGATSLGSTLTTFSVASTGLNVTAVGAVSGATTITASSTITSGTTGTGTIRVRDGDGQFASIITDDQTADRSFSLPTVGGNGILAVNNFPNNFSAIQTYSGGIGGNTQFTLSRDGVTYSNNNPQTFIITNADATGVANLQVEGQISASNYTGNVSVTSGTINGTSIGGSSASTGRFTTLQADSGLTMSPSALVTGNLTPTVDIAQDLGSPSNRWRDLYLGPATLRIQTKASETGTAKSWKLGVETASGPDQGKLKIGEGSGTALMVASDGTVEIPKAKISGSLDVPGTLTVTGSLNATGAGSINATTLGGVAPGSFARLDQANTFTAAQALTGSPVPSATTSLLQVGDALIDGSTDGTYLSINTPPTSIADLLHIQNHGATAMRVAPNGDTLINGNLTLGPANSGIGITFPDGTKQTTANQGGGIPSGFSILGPTTIPPAGFTFTGISIPQNGNSTGWTQKMDLPGTVYSQQNAVCALNSKIYALVGNGSNKFYEYDPSNDTWTARGDYPATQYGSTLATDGTNLYSAAGVLNGNYNTAIYKYDFQADTWIDSGLTQPVYHGYGCGLFYNGKLYLIGGYAGSRIDFYDFATNTWSLINNSPYGFDYYCDAVVLSGKLYITWTGDYGRDLVVYDLTNQKWSLTSQDDSNLQYQFGGRGYSALFIVNGEIYNAGGADIYYTGRSLKSVSKYSAVTDSWAAAPNMKREHAYVKGTVLNNKFYFLGGDNNGGRSFEVFDYTLATYLYVHTKN